MYAKLAIEGTIEVVSGLHIGTADAFAAIGAIDSPVARDTYGLPYIPGSSLKGKMRSLLAKKYSDKIGKTANEDGEELLRLFGSSVKDKIQRSRLIFSDAVMNNWDALKKRGVQSPTEAKMENSIDRITAEANPRQIERVIRGATFPLELIYNVEEADQVLEDIKLLHEGMLLLTYDYLGGNGSRGYGKIKFCDLKLRLLFGDLPEDILKQCNQMITEEME